jgi:hypothetical protein
MACLQAWSMRGMLLRTTILRPHRGCTLIGRQPGRPNRSWASVRSHKQSLDPGSCKAASQDAGGDPDLVEAINEVRTAGLV